MLSDLLTTPTNSLSKEDLLDTLFDATKQLFVILGADQQILYLNRYTKETVFQYFRLKINVGDHITQFIPPEMVRSFDKYFDQCMKGQPAETEKRITMAGNYARWFRISFEPVWFRNTGDKAAILNLVDITRDKDTQELHKENEANLKKLIDLIPQYVSLIDGSGKVLLANKAFRELFSYFCPNPEGFYLEDLLHGPELAASHMEKINRTLQNNRKTIQRDQHLVISSEKTIYINSTKAPFEFKGQRVVMDIAEDVTESRKAQEQIKYLASILKNTEDMANIKDKNQRIVAANDFMIKMAGCQTIDELLGKTDVELFGDLPHVRQYMEDDRKVLRYPRNKLLTSEEPFVTPDGRRLTMLTKKFPIFDDEGKVIATATVTRDITRLKDITRTKDRFLSIIAHDLKNPFGSINGFSELIIKKACAGDTDRIIDFAQHIHKASKDSYELLENLLEWARSQSGEIAFSPQNLSLQRLLRENMRLLELSAENKEIELVCEPFEDMAVFADEDMTHTILRNLLSNAIKFSHRGSRVGVNVRSADKFVEISVYDNGVGLEPDELEKLFLINEKSSKPGTERESGTGLGLILCKEFVERIGGKIGAESEAEQGSRFWFTLPLSQIPV